MLFFIYGSHFEKIENKFYDMVKHPQIMNIVPFKEILNEFLSLYLKEYGEAELRKISQKIHSSSSVNKFLNETDIAKVKPLRDDFLRLTHSIYYFTFAKAEKIALASVVSMCKWQKEVAVPNNIEDNRHLNETFFDIIEKCKGFKFQISNTDNFFTKFESIIEDRFSEVSLVQKEVQNKLNDHEFMSQLVIRRAYDDSRQFFLKEIFPFDDFDCLSEDEAKKINKQIFEMSIIVLAIVELVIESDSNKKDLYLNPYSKFLGVKIAELSKEEDYSEIFYTDEFELFSNMSSRMRFYKKEIRELIENHEHPYGIFYFFFFNPGGYSPYDEYTSLEEGLIKYSVNDSGDLLMDAMSMLGVIKDIYTHTLTKIL